VPQLGQDVPLVGIQLVIGVKESQASLQFLITAYHSVAAGADYL